MLGARFARRLATAAALLWGLLVAPPGAAAQTLPVPPRGPGDGPFPVCIEDPEALAADGMVQRADLEGLKQRLLGLGAQACSLELVGFLETQTFEVVTTFALEVLQAWGDPVAVEPLLSAYGRAMLRPMGRDEEVAFATARAIAALQGPDLRVGLHSERAAREWLELARVRYLEQWRAALDGTDASPPPLDAGFADACLDRYRACLADPESAPPDPFDPLGVLQTPSARLSVGPRCASKAVLDQWSSTEDDWSRAVTDLVRRHASQGSFLSLAIELERGWGQGTTFAHDEPIPPRDRWASPDSRTRGPGLWVLGLVLSAFTLLALRYLPEVWRGRLLAVLVGLAGVFALDVGLGAAGVPPGDELRSLASSPVPGSTAEGATVLRDLRRRPFAVPTPDGVARVGFVGASTVAGPGLGIEETIPERFRAAVGVDVPCLEVVNLGQHGFASPGIRGLAIKAVDEFDVHAVVVYTGHNEIADMRERNRYRAVSTTRLRWFPWVERSHLYGAVKSLLRPAPPESGAQQPSPAADMDRHDSVFEEAVTLRFERELMDLARAMERRGVPAVFVVPAFNHHGLRVRPVGGGNDAAVMEERVQKALDTSGDPAAAAALAREFARRWPDYPSPRFLLSLAEERVGDHVAAEAASWETLRRNQVGSASTPGVAAAVNRVARRSNSPVADAHAATHEASWPHQPGFDLFTDYVHVNPAGAEFIGAEVAKTARDAGLVTDWAGRCTP